MYLLFYVDSVCVCVNILSSKNCVPVVIDAVYYVYKVFITIYLLKLAKMAAIEIVYLSFLTLKTFNTLNNVFFITNSLPCRMWFHVI